MAALFEGVTLTPIDAPVSSSRTFDAAGATAALAYVSRCLQGHRPFSTITGSNGGALQALLARITADCEAREDLHTVRITTPTDSAQTFLTSCLAQLGFELLQGDLDDLHNLFVVFLRHESARGRRTVVIVDATEHYGPRALECMQTLSRVRAGATPAMTFVLTGSPGLHRVLDSPGMSGLKQFTRERFDLDRSLSWVATAVKGAGTVSSWAKHHQATPETPPAVTLQRQLVVMLSDAVVTQHVLVPGRLVIGRSRRCGLHLNSRFVSRQHAALDVTDTAVTAVDLRSTNATLVNGQSVTSQRVEHGDHLAIGEFRLRCDFRLR